ncbi:MAG: methionine ABC transporter ATP-binding protein [Tissierellia bacterium]|nr:methionine ABC transporter ATP-binding protein [Tissierellia bacterium]
MIKVENLYKEFNTENGKLKVLKDVSFRVTKGEIYGIIGLSGAGKSTLVRCINRLEEPTSGKVFIDDEEITSMPEKQLLEQRKEIGMIFQQFNLFNQRNVAGNISYPLEIIGMPKKDIRKRVDELLEFVDLVDKKDSYPSQLSGGQKQRVAIARALATKPKILLSDEGTSALDPENTKYILDLLRKIVSELGLTIIMITHQMEVAKDICDRIAVMEAGQIIEENTVEELFKNPKKKRTLSFIEGLGTKVEEESYSPKDFEGILVRLTFDENTARNPVVSTITKNYDVVVNILSGNINKLHSTSVGHLLLELSGDDSQVKEAIINLRDQGINVEEIK